MTTEERFAAIHARIDRITGERDAALARVRELEAALKTPCNCAYGFGWLPEDEIYKHRDGCPIKAILDATTGLTQ